MALREDLIPSSNKIKVKREISQSLKNFN